MFYRKFTPASYLQSFVECYFVWEYNRVLTEPMIVESPPNGFCSMVFNYGDVYQVQNQKYEQTSVNQSFISGQATKSYQLQLSGKIGMVGIVFKPAAMNTLFGLPMYEFTDERIALSDVLGHPLKILTERIIEADSLQQRIEMLEQFLTFQLSKTKAVLDRTDFVVNLIVEQRGIINVGDLMTELYVCRRQFERKFLQKVGVSPKYYARIRRNSHLCMILANQRWQVADWQDIIYRSGYYDQSHFIKEFTEFIGKSPSAYVKNNVELANFLST